MPAAAQARAFSDGDGSRRGFERRFGAMGGRE